FDVVVTELMTPGLSGAELLARLHQAKPQLPVILIAGAVSMETAVEVIKLGAYDFLVKPFEITELVELIERATSSKGASLIKLKPAAGDFARATLVGSSRAMQELYKKIGRAANW